MSIRKETQSLINEKDALDALLQTIDSEVDEIKKSTTMVLPITETTGFMDFGLIKKESEEESEKIINSWIVYYLTDEVKEQDYIKIKRNNDRLMLSKLLSYIKRSEHATTKLMEQIDHGNFHPRNFEVLAGMEKSQMEIIKHYIQASTIIENSYRDIQSEYEAKQMTDDMDNEFGLSSNAQSHKSLLLQLNEEMVELTDIVEDFDE